MFMKEKELEKAYNEASKNYLFSRTKGKDKTGFQNREMEQPIMFELVPKDLNNKKLLDVGCGPGIHIKKYVERGAECIGIDLSTEMIKLAKNYCPAAKFKTGNVYDLKFNDNYFDITTSSFVLDHVKDLEKAVKEVKRVLKSKGLFIFSIPHPITYMFRNSETGKFIPSNNYFDDKIFYYNVAKSGFKFPGFPRILQDYFQELFKQGFTLVEFRENKPKKEWAVVDQMFVKIPHLAFFVWKKD